MFADVVTGTRRDDDALKEGLTRWASAYPADVPGWTSASTGPPADVRSLTRAEGGMANETLLIDFGGGADHPGIVVRLPPLQATFPDYDLGPQAVVQNAVALHGIAAPAPSVFVADPQWIGCPFLVMPRVHGDVPGPAPLFDPYVGALGLEGRARLGDALIDTVVAVHAVPWHDVGVLPGSSLRAALERWDAYVAWSGEGEPLPALSEALAWCRRTCPAEREPVLLWGDVRLGNLVFDAEQRVVAVLDWDLAAIGPPEMDLGWHFGLEFMMRSLFGDTVPGFPSRAEGIRRYEEHSHRTVESLDWHEVFALVRALAINDRHQRITGSRRRRENPMGPVLLERIAATEAGGAGGTGGG